jgi:histidinol-phosphate aminotransferase
MIERLLKDYIRDIPPYVPGRSKEEVAKAHGLDPERIVKLASNENPLGPSPEAVRAITHYSGMASVYPTADASGLREALADYLGVRKEQVMAGNGSDEILDLVVKMFLGEGDEAVISIPTFSMYQALTRLYGAKPVFVPMKGGFEYDVQGMKEAVSERTKIVFVCSPNNPTGTLIPRPGLEELLEEEVVVVVDEAYVEFSEGSFIPLVEDHENLIITRTFSKAFGLAGLRVGYGVANEGIISYMARVKIPFSVNLLAEKAAMAALGDRGHLERSVQLAREGREYLKREIDLIPGLLAYPSQANFLLVDTRETEMTAAEIAEELFRRGVITRDCSSFGGLDQYYLRVSVGTREENLRFVEELKEIV